MIMVGRISLFIIIAFVGSLLDHKFSKKRSFKFKNFIAEFIVLFIILLVGEVIIKPKNNTPLTPLDGWVAGIAITVFSFYLSIKSLFAKNKREKT
jgi:uncharacterized membrane-anchored protein